MAQPLMAFLQDEFKIQRKAAAALIGGLAFLLMQPVIFFLPHGFLDEMDFWIGTIGLVVFAIIEVVLFVWVFGANKAWKEICTGSDFDLPRIFYYIIKYVTPIYLFLLLGFWFYQNGVDVLLMRNVPEANRIYIWFARLLLAGILLFMMFLVRIAWQRKRTIQQRVP